MKQLLKKPTAWIPLVMSFAGLALVLSYLAVFGTPQSPPEDEGAAAHIFQILMAGQIPIVALFAINWLPKKPKAALQIFTLQFIAILLAFAPIFFLRL